MPEPMTFDDVCDFIEDYATAVATDEFMRAASDLLDAMAPGAPGRAELLYSMGESRAMAKQPAEAMTYFERALEDGGRTTLPPVADVVACLLALGDDERADALLAELRRGSATRTDKADTGLHYHLGEILEIRDRPQEAMRWFTMGLRQVEEDDPRREYRDLLGGRYRVRRYQAMPFDGLDREFEDLDPYAANAVKERVAAGEPS